jgi:DNA-binding NarL/FixJ family response regulator
VLIYSAYADAHMIVAAIVADGVANKGGSGDDLCEAIRAVARGHPAFPPIPPTAVSAMAARLDPSDVPILGMLVHGNLAAEIADVLGITEPSLDARRWAILKRLTAPPGRPDPPSSPNHSGPLDGEPPRAHQPPEHAP